MVITFISIMALKESEVQLLHSKEILEQRVEERTSELKQANERISQARDLFFKLFYSNPSPTSLTRLTDGKFIDVKDAYLEFTDLRRDEVIGRTSFELNLPIAIENRPEIMERLRTENQLNNIELQVERASGETVTVLASIQLILIDRTEALLMSFIDISERVRAEQETRALAYELSKAEQAFHPSIHSDAGQSRR